MLSVILALSMATVAFSYEYEDTGYIAQQNEESGYYVVIDDAAGLFSDYEFDRLYETMEPISADGNVVLLTYSFDAGDTETYANEYAVETFGSDANSMLFVIDMNNRILTVWSRGTVEKKITNTIGSIITDNVYTYAKDGDYFTTANEAFKQMKDVLEGNRIAQPMKYIGNACLAVLLGLLLTYFIARKMSSTSKASNSELLDSMFSQFELNNPRVDFAYETKEYSPKSSGSGGGGFGGGGGGGGSSGGSGGSHGF